MLLEAIFGIIAISIVFCCCTFCCYIFFQFMFAEAKTEVQPEIEPWEAKHYYDPLPLSTPSPPDTIFKPTPYTFKLQNGNGVYAAPLSQALPHAVINPAVLQYPPGHVLEQQRIQVKSQQPPPAQSRKNSDRNHIPKVRRIRSRTPSPRPRLAKNVWSTNTEFQPPHNYYQQHHHHRPDHYGQQQQQSQQQYHHHHQQQYHYQQPQKQYVQLTQEHYPVYKPQKQPIQFLQEEFILSESRQRQRQPQPRYEHKEHLQEQEAQYDAFLASSHATNVYTQHRNSISHSRRVSFDYDNEIDNNRYIKQEPKTPRKHRSHRSKHKEAVT